MDWTKVVTEPLGFAAFALALFLGSRWRKGMPAWWPSAALGLAVLCAAGGMLLFYTKNQPPVPAGQTAIATGTGAQAINVQGQGNVVGTQGKGSGKPNAAPGPESPAPAPTTQRAEAGPQGVAVNISGNGNTVGIPGKE